MAEDIKDISLSTKKSFRIDGDNNRIIWLDVSDMNIMSRINDVYPEIRRLAVEAQDRLQGVKITEREDANSPLQDVADVLKDINAKMKEKLNFIFASDIADICEPTGNMYDVVGGEFRFEHIIDVLTTLYANNIKAEYRKLSERLKKHTAKYTTKGKGRRKR